MPKRELGAYGIHQSLPADKMAAFGQYRDDAVQDRLGSVVHSISTRYGSRQGTWQHSNNRLLIGAASLGTHAYGGTIPPPVTCRRRRQSIASYRGPDAGISHQKFGQNFVIGPARSVIIARRVTAADHVMEIGPELNVNLA